MKKTLSILLVYLCIVVPLIIFESLRAPSVHGYQPIFGEACNGIYVNNTEFLQFQGTAIDSQANNATIMVQYRLKRASDGKVFEDGFQTTGGATTGAGIRIPYEGCLQFVTMVINGPGTIGGADLYAQMLLMSGPVPGSSARSATPKIIPSGNQNLIEAVLLGVCANSFYTYTWPYTPVQTPESCPPSGAVLAPADPGAGANSLNALSNAVRSRVINIRYTLTTSATAGNRFACVQFLQGGTAGTVVGSACSWYAQQASQTVTYNFSAGVGMATNCNQLGATQTALLCAEIQTGLPTYWEAVNSAETGTAATFSVNTAVLASANTSGLLAGDQISSVKIRLMQWNATD